MQALRKAFKEAMDAEDSLKWAEYYERVGFPGERPRMEKLCEEKWRTLEEAIAASRKA